MKKNSKLEEKEMILLHYRLQNHLDDENYEYVSETLKKNYQELKTKLAPHKQIIMTSLVNDIKKEDFVSSISVVVNLNSIKWMVGQKLFITDLVNTYITSTSLTDFGHLYKLFLEFSNKWSGVCQALAAMWQNLNSSGNGESMEALAVWSFGSEIAEVRNNFDAQCLMEIASINAPAYKQILVSDYNSNIKYGRTSIIKELHMKYRMSYFFGDYISSLSQYELSNNNFNRLIDTIDDLPRILDKCFALDAVYQRLKHSAMLGTFEHFQTLKAVKRVKSLSDYAKADAFFKSKCDSAEQNAPAAFKRVLNEEASNCKLINRVYSEPLYCTSEDMQEHGYRRILTKVNKDDELDQYWNISVSTHGVNLRNNNHTSFEMRYIHDKVRGSSESQSMDHDYFHIHSIDDYILLQPTSEKRYVSATAETFRANNYDGRIVGMTSDFNDQKSHWKLVCY